VQGHEKSDRSGGRKKLSPPYRPERGDHDDRVQALLFHRDVFDYARRILKKFWEYVRFCGLPPYSSHQVHVNGEGIFDFCMLFRISRWRYDGRIADDTLQSGLAGLKSRANGAIIKRSGY